MSEPQPDPTDEIWVYVEFAFDARVAHYYGRMDAKVFERLLAGGVEEMVELSSPYWYNDQETLLSGRDYLGGNVLHFSPRHLAFIMRLALDSSVMKDIHIAEQMGDIGLHHMENN